jgi:small GTP-binding protein
MPDEEIIKTKVCLMGESSVGKSSLIRRFVLDVFDDAYISTIGTKVSKRSIDLSKGDKKYRMDMQIWDIMGNKGFRILLQEAYFHGASGIIAVCDSTKMATKDDLEDWIKAAQGVAGQVPVVILSNKADLKDQMEVAEKDIMELANKYGAVFHAFTSAKTGTNVEETFQKIGEEMLKSALK